MSNLKKEVAAITNQQWTILLTLLTLVNIVILGGLVWLLTIYSPGGFRRVLAQAPATRTPFPTFTPARYGYSFPTPMNTLVPTWTPSVTFTPPPPTVTPTATRFYPTQAPPIQVTDTPTVTPTPVWDYMGTIRQLTPCENQGKHHIFLYVRDKAGNGIPGVNARVFWEGGNGGEAKLITGTKIEDPGLADFAMFKGSYYIEILDGLSQVIGPISPDIPQNETCEESGNTEANSLYHYSFEVVFTKVR